jgi:hypothetical protein
MSAGKERKKLRQDRKKMTYIESFAISLEEHICTLKIIGLAVGTSQAFGDVVEHTQPDHHEGGRHDTIRVAVIHGDL